MSPDELVEHILVPQVARQGDRRRLHFLDLLDDAPALAKRLDRVLDDVAEVGDAYRAGAAALECDFDEYAEPRLRRAAQQGHPEAAAKLAVVLARRGVVLRRRGRLVAADRLLNEAVVWQTDAAAAGAVGAEDLDRVLRRRPASAKAVYRQAMRLRPPLTLVAERWSWSRRQHSPRWSVAARGLAAVVGCVLLVGFVPVALTAWAGPPLPADVPSVAQLADSLANVDVGAGAVSTLALMGWVGWVELVACLLTEAVAHVRGRRAARLPLAGVVQLFAARLVATAALLGSLAAPRGVAVGYSLAAPREPRAAVVPLLLAEPDPAASPPAEGPMVLDAPTTDD